MLQMRTRGSAFKVSFHIGTPGSFLSPHTMATAPRPSQGLSLPVPPWLQLWSPNELAVSASPLFCRRHALGGTDSLLSLGEVPAGDTGEETCFTHSNASEGV